ncbi:hypothetical protein AB6A40_006332 [Gnathostoma spinigerum]|uniref:Uncharacterized protein n=1 Tax=Gnathostoma spinigerum TaxID=75299 RepID=A0ABD6EIA8_9BILA
MLAGPIETPSKTNTRKHTHTTNYASHIRSAIMMQHAISSNRYAEVRSNRWQSEFISTTCNVSSHCRNKVQQGGTITVTIFALRRDVLMLRGLGEKENNVEALFSPKYTPKKNRKKQALSITVRRLFLLDKWRSASEKLQDVRWMARCLFKSVLFTRFFYSHTKVLYLFQFPPCSSMIEIKVLGSPPSRLNEMNWQEKCHCCSTVVRRRLLVIANK